MRSKTLLNEVKKELDGAAARNRNGGIKILSLLNPHRTEQQISLLVNDLVRSGYAIISIAAGEFILKKRREKRELWFYRKDDRP